MGQNGTFQQAPLDGLEEAAVEMGDWLGASQLAEGLVQTHWGDDRRTRLASHHRAVVALVSRHGWPVARKYDINVRRKASQDSTHDLATIDNLELAIVIAEVGQARVHTSAGWSPSFHDSHSTSWPTSGNGLGKRPRAFDDRDGRPAKIQRQVKCFRCGSSGHTQAKCRAATTTSGLSCASVVVRNGTPTLVSSDGSQFCFNWARGESRCPFGTRCANLHACSLCHAKDHGAGSCPKHL